MKNFFVSMIALGAVINANAQSLELDATYGTNGYTLGSLTGNHHDANTIRINADQTAILLGSDWTNDHYTSYLSKYTTNGTLDNTFGINGIVRFTDNSNLENYFLTMELQSDGKILVGGYNEDINTEEKTYYVKRYLTNGVIDSAFGTNGYAEIFHANTSLSAAFIAQMSIQNDGKILVCSEASSNSALTRLNANGGVDSTFGTNGIVDIDVATTNGLSYRNVQTLSNGNIILGAYVAYSTPTATINEIRTYRLNSNGTLDNTYGTAGKYVFSLSNKFLGVYSMVLQSDNKALIGGFVYEDGNDTTQMLVLRLNTDGTLDNTFNTQGYVEYPIPSDDAEPVSVHLLSNGKLAYTYVDYADYSTGIVMFNTNGTVDATFNNGSELKKIGGIEDGVSAPNLAFQSDGKILFAGGVALDNQQETGKSIIGRLYNKPTSVSEIKGVMIKVYPNPAQNAITIDLQQAQKATVSVLDISGKVMLTNTIQSKQHIDISGLMNGSYLLMVTTTEGTAYQKLQIAR